MTAQEARALFDSKRGGRLQELLATVKLMADAGYDFATKPKKFVDREIKQQLVDLGYDVQICESYITIKW